MGTQFSKIKVTQRVEVQGEVLHYKENYYDQYRRPSTTTIPESSIAGDELDLEDPDLYTRRAHHSGVLSGHELLSYSFLGGQACQPRRSIRRKHRQKFIREGSLLRSTSKNYKSKSLDNKYLVVRGCRSGDSTSSNEDSSRDSELDSGISVNVNNYDHEPRLHLIQVNSSISGSLKEGKSISLLFLLLLIMVIKMLSNYWLWRQQPCEKFVLWFQL